MTPISIRVPATAKEAIFDGLNEFKKKHDLASIGQALEFAVADKTQGPNVLAYLYEAINLLHGVQVSLAKRGGFENESNWISLAKDRVNTVYKTLLEGSREIHEEKVPKAKDPGSNEEDEGREDRVSEQRSGTIGKEEDDWTDVGIPKRDMFIM
jgi:hypothetical protein